MLFTRLSRSAMRPLVGSTRGTITSQTTAAPQRILQAVSLTPKRYNSFESMYNAQTKERKRTMKGFQDTVSEAEKRNQIRAVIASGHGLLFPNHFVAAPIAEFPRSPRKFLSYVWEIFKNRLTSTITVLQTRVKSQENGLTSWPRWKFKRSKIAPTAKVMYRSVLEAFAAGDNQALEKLCTEKFANQLNRAIASRPAGQRVQFEMEDARTLRFPKVKSYIVSPANPMDIDYLQEQAIVAVASKQKMIRETTVRGSDKADRQVKIDDDKLEYVIMVRSLDSATWESGQWKIWGTTNVTDLEAHRAKAREANESVMNSTRWKSEKAQKIQATRQRKMQRKMKTTG